jgi:hypothetical protein
MWYSRGAQNARSSGDIVLLSKLASPLIGIAMFLILAVTQLTYMQMHSILTSSIWQKTS